MQFKLVSKYKPTGDQPKAIDLLTKNIEEGARHQVLLGVTGSGKTFTMSNVIARTQRPALVISPNKTLAAQLYQEFKEFFPRNAVHYFVSYYDYYQPEAYIPQSDTYIEKDAKVNEVLDRLRHEATQDLLSRKDVIVVASVSCIYNIGSPEDYRKISLELKPGQKISRRRLISFLTALQYRRDDMDFVPGTFRVRGDIVEVFLVTGKELLQIEFFGDKISSLRAGANPLRPSYGPVSSFRLFPAKFWVTPEDKLKLAVQNIRAELESRLQELKAEGKLPEAERLEQRTTFDLEMIEETGYCHGIENYSRHMEFRNPGEPAFSLLDYFPENFLTFVDESHLTLSQVKAMSVQDRIRKESLVAYGFRLPSSVDNRPLTIDEFYQSTKQIVYVSATPGAKELELARSQKPEREYVAEQIIRPTGLLEPAIEIRTAKNQFRDLEQELKRIKEKGERALVVTLTKRLAEEISRYLEERGIRAEWLHSEIKTLERPEFLSRLRRGEIDAIVGINLLREGLDLPEVALVAILDADKEGFLRNATTLIQTMGRAARHPRGRAVLYADKTTDSMKRAMEEIGRRREKQKAYNKKHGITPSAIQKAIAQPLFFQKKEKEIGVEFGNVRDVRLLEREMKEAAASLDFGRAAELRDMLKKLSLPDRDRPV